MKVAFVSTVYYPNHVGGAEKTVRLLAEGVMRAGHDAVVVSLAPDGIAHHDTVAGVRAIYLPLANVYWPLAQTPRTRWLKPLWHLIDAYNPLMGRRLGHVLDAERPDIAHMHNLKGFSVAAWTAARRRSIPIVQTIHDYYLGCPNSTMFRLGRNCARQCIECRLLRLPERLLVRLPCDVTGVSERTIERLRQCHALDGTVRSAVIRGCNDDGPVLGPPPAPKDPGGRPLRFGFLGRLEPIKGVESFLQAARGLPADLVEIRIAGTGPPAFEAYLRSRYGHGNVAFLGFVDPDVFFREIDVLVTPSIWEDPLPRVVHEAMGHGVPVLGAAIGGIPEMIEAGSTGFLFEPGNVEDLRTRMLRIAMRQHPLQPLAEAAYRQSARYLFDKIFAEYMDVLHRATTHERQALPNRPAARRSAL